MSTQTRTFDTAAGPIQAGKRYLIDFDARLSSGNEDDWGTIDGQWTGEVDTWGKLTIRDTFGRPNHYLFPEEIIDLDGDPDGDPNYHPQLSAIGFLYLLPANWDRAIVAMKGQERRALADELTSRATQAACAAAYVSARAIGRDHQYGVKQRNRVNTTVRKALGYSYPKDDLNF